MTRVMTPGTVVEPALLEEGKANYLMGILPVGDVESGQWTRAGIAFADILHRRIQRDAALRRRCRHARF